MFFVATAPLAGDGHVNVSPKGMAGTFAVLDPHRVGYLDYFGSGVETIAHLRENGRITLMFAARSPARRSIVRLHGRGRVGAADDRGFAELRGRFGKQRTTAQRAIIVVDVDRVADSCGYAVPLMDFVADRDVLDLRQEKKGAGGLRGVPGHPRTPVSIDGLPGLGTRLADRRFGRVRTIGDSRGRRTPLGLIHLRATANLLRRRGTGTRQPALIVGCISFSRRHLGSVDRFESGGSCDRWQLCQPTASVVRAGTTGC